MKKIYFRFNYHVKVLSLPTRIEIIVVNLVVFVVNVPYFVV
jgi:hypothetical protein